MKISKIQKFKTEINRQRVEPNIFDYSYLLLRSNFETFLKFRDLVETKRGKILDVGCGFKPWESLFDSNVNYIGIDFDKQKSDADFVGGAESLPFKDNEFDALIYSEVLEHVGDLTMAISEMRRVVKNGGFVFCSSPFMFPEHGIPYDFQRLTKYFYKKIFIGDELIVLRPSNTSISSAVVSLNLVIESTPARNFYGLKHIIYIFFNAIGMIIDMVLGFILRYSPYFKKYEESFFLIPLGYSVIVRIKK